MMIGNSDIKKIMDALMVEHWGILTIDKENLDDLSERERTIRELLQRRGKKEFEQDLERRFMFLSKKTVGTIIAIGIPYEAIGTAAPTDFGLVDNFSWEHDYHEVLRNILTRIHSKFSEILNDQGAEPEICVDTSDYIDREIGLYTGLGKIGKNHFLINPEMGTQFFIGYLIYDRILDVDKSAIHHFDLQNTLLVNCENCNNCVLACPANICGEAIMDSSKCIAMLTQTKRELNECERELIDNRLYGCNICQKVCPMNKGVHAHLQLATKTENFVDLYELLDMSKNEFLDKYGEMAFSWRSLWVYKRNALIILGNRGKQYDLDFLKNKMDLKKNPKLEETYLWAIKRLENRET